MVNLSLFVSFGIVITSLSVIEVGSGFCPFFWLVRNKTPTGDAWTLLKRVITERGEFKANLWRLRALSHRRFQGG